MNLEGEEGVCQAKEVTEEEGLSLVSHEQSRDQKNLEFDRALPDVHFET